MSLVFRDYPVFYARGLFWIIKDGRYDDAASHPWGFVPRREGKRDHPANVAIVPDGTPAVTPEFIKASDELFLSPQLRLYFKFVIDEHNGLVSRPDFAIPLYETITNGTGELGWVRSTKKLHARWTEFQTLLTGNFNIYHSRKYRGYVAAHASITISSSNFRYIGSVGGIREPLFGWTKEERYDRIHPDLSSFVKHHLCYCAAQPFTKRSHLFPVTELKAADDDIVPWKSGRLPKHVQILINKWKSQQSWGK